MDNDNLIDIIGLLNWYIFHIIFYLLDWEWISKGIVFDENENVIYDRFFNHGIRMNIVEMNEIENRPNE